MRWSVKYDGAFPSALRRTENSEGGATHALVGLLIALGMGAVLFLAAPSRLIPALEAGAPSRQAAEQLSAYVARLREQDAAAIADMFESDGSSVHEGQAPVIGRETIRTLLESFSSYRVQSHTMAVTKTSEHDAEVVQVGTFDQTVLSPEAKTIHVSGSFTATWRRQPNGDMLLHRTQTAPR